MSAVYFQMSRLAGRVFRNRFLCSRTMGLQSCFLKVLSVTAALSVSSFTVQAHSGFALPDEPKLSASMVAGYVDSDEDDPVLWQVPGILMGGDAYGPESGFQLYEANLGIEFGNDEGLLVLAELGSHGHGHSDKVEIEQAVLGWYTASDSQQFRLEMGKRKALFAPLNAAHSSSLNHTRKPLVYDVFLGGHFVDTGAAVRWLLPSGFAGWDMESGLELWRGDAFPASSDAGVQSLDMYLKWRWHQRDWQAAFGLWYLQSDASDRSDSRLDGDHDHGVESIAPEEIARFTGESKIHGIHAQLSRRLDAKLSLSLSGEYWLVDVDGDVRDDTRLSELEGDYTGYWLQSSLTSGAHTLSLRYDRLVLENELRGTGAGFLAETSGLEGMGRDPELWSVAYAWEFIRGLSVRAEYVEDKTMAEKRGLAGINLAWKQSFSIW